MDGSKQQWNAAEYAREGRFVADLAGSLVDMLDAQPGEHILDLGCGDGVLTQRIAQTGAQLVGVDSSPAMAEAAKTLGLDARLFSIEALPFKEEFDAVFSNAALHWVRDQDAALAGVARALKPGGRFVAEMGGHGNIAALRVALCAALQQAGHGALALQEQGENHFPTSQAYRARLEVHGFVVQSIELRPRPTPLGPGGARGWYEVFRTGVLHTLPQADREIVLRHAEALLAPVLCDAAGQWVADYVRLRFLAKKL